LPAQRRRASNSKFSCLDGRHLLVLLASRHRLLHNQVKPILRPLTREVSAKAARYWTMAPARATPAPRAFIGMRRASGERSAAHCALAGVSHDLRTVLMLQANWPCLGDP
jgi:hypothetical protein